MRTAAEIQKELPTSLESGLAETGLDTSRTRFGRNTLTPLPREPLWKKFLEKFDEPIIKILLAAALLSMVVDLFKSRENGVALGGIGLGLVGLVLVVGFVVRPLREWVPAKMFGLAFVLFFIGLATGHWLVEGLAVMVAVLLATGVAFLSEYRSDREFEVLNARKDALLVKTIRGGQLRTVSLEEVLVGDLVVLEMGDEVPADGRLVKSTDLHIDQSLMTGETEPVKKHWRPVDDDSDGPDKPGCLYRGTQVVDGVGHQLVTEVGDATYLGQIARRLSADEGEDEAEEATQEAGEERRVKKKLTISKELTPLQEKLTNLAGLISKVGYIAAVLIFCAQLLLGILHGKVYIPQSPDQIIPVLGELLDYFVLMVIIIVVAVPEGLPMSVTVSLALAMRKMTRANSLVRQLVACETIGSATVICSDKTGTLTQNRMRVERVGFGTQVMDRDTPLWVLPDGVTPWPRELGKPLDWIALNAAANSTANLEAKEGKLVTVGNSTEGALLQWLHEAGARYTDLRLQFPARYQIHFSSERKRMTTVVRHGGHLVALVKGASEILLDRTTRYLDADGTVREWTPETREMVHRQLQEAAGRAMRTLGFGFVPLPPDATEDEEDLHGRRERLDNELIFAGFVAIRDPLRDDVKDAVAQCRAAGIEVKMITGDNVNTARAIAYDIGLIARADEPVNTLGSPVLTSERFNELSDEELKKALPGLRVLARARPLDKFRMVKALQELGEVVAVTGDGTNDAPALKKADVGLAMGIAGTEVAKEASKIVLLDDAFSTIVKAVHWGRSLYENIQRFIQFQLTINVSALTIAFLGPLLFGVKAPFTVLQLLWINVIMDTFASIALCSEPPRAGLMDVPPKRRDENIVTPTMASSIFVTATFFVVTMILLLVAMKGAPDAPAWLAGWLPETKADTAWSFESAGGRYTVPTENLERVDATTWRIVAKGNPDLAQLDGATGEVAFTVLQVTLFFTVYVFFQVWNQINCRSLVPEVSGLRGLFRNPTFLAIATAVAVGQFLIVTFGGPVFKVQRLDWLQWLVIIGSTASVLVFVEIVRPIRVLLKRAK